MNVVKIVLCIHENGAVFKRNVSDLLVHVVVSNVVCVCL